jgi:hypothetical protein
VRWILFAAAAACFAQTPGTVPKPKAEEYEVHSRAGRTGVGAEYMVHSFSSGEQVYLVDGYLVVEVALYPPKGMEVQVRSSDFALRINGAKRPLGTASPQMVVADMKRPAWRQGPHLEAGAGMGNTGVVLGRPAPAQLPGGPPATGPTPPRAPDSTPGGIERPEPEKAEDVLLRTALPQGDFEGAVSGYLYFPYKGKSTKVRSVDLLCYGLTLKLK